MQTRWITIYKTVIFSTSLLVLGFCDIPVRGAEKKPQLCQGNYQTEEEAKEVGEKIGIKWDKFDVDQFRRGMDVELEHGTHDPNTNVTDDDPIMTGKIALAHLNEFPDYYDRLEEMEEEGVKYWEEKEK